MHVYTDQGASGNLLLENLNVVLNFDGFLDFGAESVVIRNSKFDLNGGSTNGSGIFASSYSVVVEGTTLTQNTYGIYTLGGVVNLVNTTVTKSKADGIYLGSIYDAYLQNVTSSENVSRGVYVLGEDSYRFSMRSSTLANNTKQGLQITGNEFGSWDLGTAQEPGGNILQDNSSWQIYDNRVANTGVTIQAQGNSIGASGTLTTPTGTQTGPNESSSGAVKIWRIEQPGNSISF